MPDKKEAQCGGFFLVTTQPLNEEQTHMLGGALAQLVWVLQARPVPEGNETRNTRTKILSQQKSNIILPEGMSQ